MKLLKTIGLSVILCAGFSFAIQYGSFTDKRDGKKYKTVKIGNITWFAENLSYSSKNSFCFSENNTFCQEYGRLYAAKQGVGKSLPKVCPRGTHLSTSEEWELLLNYADNNSEKMKTKEGWIVDRDMVEYCKHVNAGSTEYHSAYDMCNGYKNANGINDLGFSAKPGGFAISPSSSEKPKEYLYLGKGAFFLIDGKDVLDYRRPWTASIVNWVVTFGQDFLSLSNYVYHYDYDAKKNGGKLGYSDKVFASVRCVVDY